jgi:hypothetical protein
MVLTKIINPFLLGHQDVLLLQVLRNVDFLCGCNLLLLLLLGSLPLKADVGGIVHAEVLDQQINFFIKVC